MRRHQSQVKYEVNIKLSFVYKWQSELRKTNYERETIACICYNDHIEIYTVSHKSMQLDIRY